MYNLFLIKKRKGIYIYNIIKTKIIDITAQNMNEKH